MVVVVEVLVPVLGLSVAVVVRVSSILWVSSFIELLCLLRLGVALVLVLGPVILVVVVVVLDVVAVFVD